jgi:hypothetical protein
MQIEIGGSMGSGFFVQASNRMFLVTARHVLFDISSTNRPLPLRGTNLSFSSWNGTMHYTTNYNIEHYYASKEVRYSNDRDVAVVHFCNLVGTNQIPGFEFRYVNTSPTNWEATQMAVEAMRKIADVKVAEDAYTFGYPVSVGSVIAGQQLDSTRPLARKGIIADVDLRRKVLVADMPVNFGNSGALLMLINNRGFAFSRATIVGVVSQFIPFEDVWISQRYKLPNVSWSNSGYAIVEPIDFVIDLLW